ncbi:MAG: nucleotidyltransferase substrate binding protein [Elusimicrobia bacterium]|nr:nucleotidyltransferase substrate binding protein [Elusimicrobiota bacterium]
MNESEIFKSLKKSLERLKEILGEKRTIANRDSAIKRFEFTVELTWKTMQKFLRNQKIICRSPKECLKESFKIGLIKDNPIWLEMLDDRNLTVHTYDEKLADEVYDRLSNYLPLFEEIKNNLEKIQK